MTIVGWWMKHFVLPRICRMHGRFYVVDFGNGRLGKSAKDKLDSSMRKTAAGERK